MTLLTAIRFPFIHNHPFLSDREKKVSEGTLWFPSQRIFDLSLSTSQGDFFPNFRTPRKKPSPDNWNSSHDYRLLIL